MRYLWYPIFLMAWLLSFSAHALEDTTLAVAAAQYLQSIRDSRAPFGQWDCFAFCACAAESAEKVLKMASAPHRYFFIRFS